jgi:hypothetical protein
MKLRVVFAATFSALALVATLLGHGGGLDANGCHNNRKTGEYHCHGKRSTGQEGRPSRPSLPVAASPAVPLELPVARRPAVEERELVVATQILLTALGYEPGPAEGELTATTVSAIRKFQRDAYLSADGRLTGGLLVRLAEAVLRRESAVPSE